MIGIILVCFLFLVFFIACIVAAIARSNERSQHPTFCRRERYHQGPCNGYPSQTCYVYDPCRDDVVLRDDRGK